jgi:hypothetical protein
MIARFIMISIASAAVLVAQKSESPSVCWTARPLATCKGWVVTEIGLERAVASTIVPPRRASYPSSLPDFATRVVLTVGGMKNRDSVLATGLTISVGSNDPDQYYRAEFRHRRWLPEELSVEYSVGLTVMNIHEAGRRRSPHASGVTGGVSLGIGPVGLDARADLLAGTSRPIAGLSAGVKAAGKAMPFATLALGAFVAFYALASS